MYFGFTEEQDMLRQSVRRFLEQRCPIKEVRKLKVIPAGYSEALWQEMAQAGWLGVTLPEQYGGLGLSWLDLTVILEEMGRGLLPSPFLSNTLAATALLELGNDKQKQRLLPILAAGKSKAASLKEGKARLVVEAVSNDMRGSTDSVSNDVNIVLAAPRVIPDDAQHYINQGGMEMLTMTTSGSWNNAGVRVANYTFRSFPLPGKSASVKTCR